MASLKFFYDNLWNDETLVASSEHSNFPASNTQLRDFNNPWRSNYGAGSGWGTFTITANTNDRLDFIDSFVATLAAVLTPAAYTADTLAAHIKAQMDAVSGDTWTVEYLESGASANKFKITSDDAGGAGSVSLLWNTGANSARTIGSTIGYTLEGDSIGALTYTADDIRIHTTEYVIFTRTTTINVYGAIIRGHNFQAGATVKLVGSNDDFVTWHFSDTFTIQDDILILEYDTVKTYQDWGIYVYDVDNPAGYVEMGVVFLGAHFQPTKHFAYNRTITPEDPSLIKESEDGQVTSIQHSHFKTWQYQFLGTNQKSSFDVMFDDRGFSKSLFICEDPDTPLTTTFYVMFRGWSWEHLFDSDYNLSLTAREER